MRGESTWFHIFRYILYLLVIIAYLLYLCYLIYNIINDKPNLKVDQIFLNEIDIPDIAICGTQELNILRCDLKKHGVIREKIDGCNNYILPNAADYGLFRRHCLTFKTNKTIKFTNTDIGGYDQIGFSFYDNTTATEAGTIGIASLTILLIPSDFNPVTNPNKAFISQMDKATLSELKLQLNFIAGMSRYAAVVKFKTSTYRSILPGDSNAIFGLEPNYHVTSKIENFYNYFPFNNNPYNIIPEGTTGYFSVAAGSFIQEQTSEERSNTILGAIAAAGGASGTTAAILIFFFGDFRLSPHGFAHKSHNFIQNLQNLISFIKRSKFYSEPELKFSKIDDKDKEALVDEFKNIRYAIYHHLLYQDKMDSKMNKDRKCFIERLGNEINIFFSRIRTKIHHWILNAKYIEEMFKKYEVRKRLEFSSINDEDKKFLVDEFDKIRHVIDVYTLGKKEDPKTIAAYKYKRELIFSKNTKNKDKELHIISEEELKFSNNTNNEDKELHIISSDDQKLLNDEFRKIRKLIDKHLLDQPKIEKIFMEYDFLEKHKFPDEDMDEDKKMLNDVFQQISHVIFNYLLDVPKDEEKFNK